jgi:uncharacterized membrane protein YphA (DoxX/SURF4 family)
MMQSSPFNFRRVIIWLGRLLLGGIFVYAGYSKLFYPNHNLWPYFLLKFSISANLSTFAFQVDSFKVLPAGAVAFVAHTLPFVEIVLGLLLLIGWRLRIWAAVTSAILVGFLCVVTRAYVLHMDINCGCFAAPEPLTIKTVIRDSALVLLAVFMTVFAFQEARHPHPWAAAQSD